MCKFGACLVELTGLHLLVVDELHSVPVMLRSSEGNADMCVGVTNKLERSCMAWQLLPVM